MSTPAPSGDAGAHGASSGTGTLPDGGPARVYATAVRRHLGDLPADVVDELAGGLEADLAELAAESSTPLAERLGDPAGYAAELRASAGLPLAPVGAAGASRAPGSRTAAALGADVRRTLVEVREALTRQSWWVPVRDFAVTLRPAWWLLRAWVAFWLITDVLTRGSAGGASGLLPGGLVGFLVLAAFVWVSVQLGRGRWQDRRWFPTAVVIGNVVAALAVLPVLAGASGRPVEYIDSTGGDASVDPALTTGLVLDGEQVSNLFPYDAAGNALTGVQLLDDRGRPVTIGKDSRFQYGYDDGSHPFLPAVDALGQVRWNAFPLRAAANSDGSGAATAVPLPTPTLPALIVPPAAPPSSPSTSQPSASASASASASPGGEPASPTSSPVTAPPAPSDTASPAPSSTTAPPPAATPSP